MEGSFSAFQRMMAWRTPTAQQLPGAKPADRKRPRSPDEVDAPAVQQLIASSRDGSCVAAVAAIEATSVHAISSSGGAVSALPTAIEQLWAAAAQRSPASGASSAVGVAPAPASSADNPAPVADPAAAATLPLAAEPLLGVPPWSAGEQASARSLWRSSLRGSLDDAALLALMRAGGPPSAPPDFESLPSALRDAVLAVLAAILSWHGKRGNAAAWLLPGRSGRTYIADGAPTASGRLFHPLRTPSDLAILWLRQRVEEEVAAPASPLALPSAAAPLAATAEAEAEADDGGPDGDSASLAGAREALGAELEAAMKGGEGEEGGGGAFPGWPAPSPPSARGAAATPQPAATGGGGMPAAAVAPRPGTLRLVLQLAPPGSGSTTSRSLPWAGPPSGGSATDIPSTLTLTDAHAGAHLSAVSTRLFAALFASSALPHLVAAWTWAFTLPRGAQEERRPLPDGPLVALTAALTAGPAMLELEAWMTPL